VNGPLLSCNISVIQQNVNCVKFIFFNKIIIAVALEILIVSMQPYGCNCLLAERIDVETIKAQ